MPQSVSFAFYILKKGQSKAPRTISSNFCTRCLIWWEAKIYIMTMKAKVNSSYCAERMMAKMSSQYSTNIDSFTNGRES